MPHIDTTDTRFIADPHVSELVPKLISHLMEIYDAVDENELDESTISVSCGLFSDTVELLLNCLACYEGLEVEEMFEFIEARRHHKHFMVDTKQ